MRRRTHNHAKRTVFFQRVASIFNKKTFRRIGATVLCVGWAALLFLHPYFTLREFEIVGRERIPEKDLRSAFATEKSKKLLGILPENNFFSFQDRALEKDLRARYAVEFLRVEKIFPHLVRLSMKEKLSQIAVSYGGSAVLVGSDGTVVARAKESPEILRSLYPVVIVYASSTPSFSVDAPVVAPALVSAVMRLSSAFSQMKIPITSYGMDTASDTVVRVKTSAGWRIILDTSKDLDAQLKTFTVIFHERFRGKPNVQFIDVRFPGRVFYE